MIAIGSVVVLALLAGAADGSTGSSVPIPIPRAPLIVAGQTFLWLVIATAAGLLALMIYAVATDRSSIVAEPRRKQSMLTYLLMLVPTLTMVAALLYLRRRGDGSSILGAFGLGGAVPPAPAGQANGLQGPDTVWLSLILAALIAGIVLAWLFWPERRPRPRRKAIPQETRQPMVEAVDETIDALRAIADPRQAIIAAYSAMESSLVRAGVRRRRSDTPLEFLSHALEAVLGISIDAGRLTYLFEFAKFSPHDVDESMRADALGALLNIRSRVGATVST